MSSNPQAITPADLAARFTYHPPQGPEDVLTYQRMRTSGHALAKILIANCPPCRETSLAITHIEEAIMWGNAAIARHGRRDLQDHLDESTLGP